MSNQQQTPASVRIKNITQTPEMLTIHWQNNATSEHSWFWLKDHGEDAASLNPATMQREVDTFTIDPAIQPESVKITADGSGINILCKPS